ncbi:hypothetical protein QBC43DRAFT_370486 [Cladorrhinum sp. PSN259]|nr:hypothetical protein QBC43DRAFT_370486 [Cladorrhinum sp. PSN259]
MAISHHDERDPYDLNITSCKQSLSCLAHPAPSPNPSESPTHKLFTSRINLHPIPSPMYPFYRLTQPHQPQSDGKMNEALTKAKNTILKGLGKPTTPSASSESAPTETEQQRNAMDPTYSSSSQGVPGHVEQDYGDMTAEWEPNRLEKSESMSRRALGESSQVGGGSSSKYKNANEQGRKAQGDGDMFKSDPDSSMARAVLIGEHFGS